MQAAMRSARHQRVLVLDSTSEHLAINGGRYTACERLLRHVLEGLEVFVTTQGRHQYLWRVVDEDGDVLDIFVQSHRKRRAAVRFFRKLLKTQGRIPRRLITDQLRSYPAACRTVGGERASGWRRRLADHSQRPPRRLYWETAFRSMMRKNCWISAGPKIRAARSTVAAEPLMAASGVRNSWLM